MSRASSIFESCVQCGHKSGNAQKAESGAIEVMTIIQAVRGHQECGSREPEAGLEDLLAREQKADKTQGIDEVAESG